MKTISLVFAALLLSACGGSGTECVESPRLYVVTSDAALTAAASAGADWWTAAGEDAQGPIVVSDSCLTDAPCAWLVWSSKLAADVGGLTTLMHNGDSEIAIDAELPSRTDLPDGVAIAVAHEIGHALGRGHVSEPSELMDPHSPMHGRLCIDGANCKELGE